MNIFKFDSPVMNFIGKVADMILLNILTFVLSIPIITFGAAYTAKYYVSMKIIRGEEGTLFKAYFKSFKENFKQATLIWIIQLVVLCVLGADWFWIYFKGFSNVNNIYIVGIVLITLFVLFITMTIFPFIARFELTTKEAYKGAGIFSFLYFIKLIAPLALEIMTVLACIWYAEWLPAILVFGTTTSFYFMNLILIKGFKKLEAKVEKEEEEKAEEERKEAAERGEEVESELGDTLLLRPDEHTIKGKFEAEKQTFKSLGFKEKLVFIKDYYLLNIIIGICVAIFAGWFLYDSVLSKKDVLYSGGLLYCAVSEEGKEYLTDDFFDEIATKKHKQEVMLDDNLTMNFVEDEAVPSKTDPVQDQNLFTLMVAGYYDYFFIDAKFIDHYMELDDFKDLRAFADEYNIPLEDRYIYIEKEESEEESEEGSEELVELSEEELATMPISAIKLPDEVCEKIGVRSLTGEGVYLALVINKKGEEVDENFLTHIFGY